MINAHTSASLTTTGLPASCQLIDQSTDVGRDADLLNTLLNEAPPFVDHNGCPNSLNAKLIAHWTDHALQTVSDYRTGNLNIPVSFWRRILIHYMDARILALLIPDGYAFEVTPLNPATARTGPEWFSEAVKAEGAYHKQMMYVAAILEDGKVDESDAVVVQAFDDAYHAHRQRDAELHRDIVHQYKRAVAAKGAPR